MINIINLLKDDVVVYVNDNVEPAVFKAQGPIQTRMKTEDVTKNGIVKKGYWTHTRGLPSPTEDTLYIVSSLTAMFELLQNSRTDLLFPWGLIRNNQTQVMACRALVRAETHPDQG